MQDTQRFKNIIRALPPHIRSGSELPSEALRLEFDAYLESSQPTLHRNIHGISRLILDAPDSKDLYDPEANQYVLSPLQLRGLIAAGAIAGAEITLITIGENLVEAQELENQTFAIDSDRPDSDHGSA